MKQLWSPWRMDYIQSPKNEPHMDTGEESESNACVFCTALRRPDGVENLIVVRGQRAFIIMNRYPYTSGHLMIVPYAHVSSLNEVDPETRSEMMELANQAIQVLESAYHPEGINLGMNLGEAAGAGIAEHIHLHVVPRWNGDTNFMSSVAGVRVLPEALNDTYLRVLGGWKTG